MNTKETPIFPSLIGVSMVMAFLLFLFMFKHAIGNWCINTANAAIGLLGYLVF
jgi:Na+-transporting methylmalonyl-CoA/oxaloacetate decarboxylase gamma subunit